MHDYFDLKGHNTTVKREFIGGLTTFLTMAYIIFVNPGILSETGMDASALVSATCLAAAVGTGIFALWVRVPLAMAPGMGLNAFFTYTLVLGRDDVTWETALGIVFLSGFFFLILSLTGVREKIIAVIPHSLRLSVGAGIGLFITFIGMQNMGLVRAHEKTLVTLGEFSPSLFLGLAGLFVTAILMVKNIRGALLWGIFSTYVLGIITGEVVFQSSIVSLPPSLKPIAFELDIIGAFQTAFMGAIFSFMFVDLFDSAGTILACSHQAGMVKEDGSIPDLDKMLEADALATIFGSLLGTSTTTTYVESAAGITDGARTGLSSLFVAFFFLFALFFAPLITSVPLFATSPTLIIVGIFMFRVITDIDFSDLEVAIPAFLTIAAMPLTYSISNGISLGLVSYLVISTASGDAKKIPPLLWGAGVLSLMNFVVAV
jgi:AGZA family xanthine/uracil permease-like MFS transporter